MSYLSPKHLIISGLAASAALLSTQTLASGYAIREISPSLMGNAYAGMSTSNEDISAIATNPATLAMIEKNSFYLSGTGIFPGIEANNINGDVHLPRLDPLGVGHFPVSGSSTAGNIGKDAFVPAGFFAWDASEMVKLGLAVTAPWGLETGYDDDWAGRYFGVNTKLESVNINPMASLSFNEHLSIAAGFQAQYLNAKLSQAVPFPVTVSPAPPFVDIFDLRSQVKGNGWGYGYTLGALYEFTKHTRIGAGFQSKITTTIEGNATADAPNPVLDPALPNLIGDAQTDITTPEKINLGVSHDINRFWTVMADVEWTHWSRFQDLTIDIDNIAGGETTSTVVEDWENTWFYSLGATFRPTKKWTLRSGVAYDQSPVDDQNRNPTIPDSDRILLAVGAGYDITCCIRVDLGYSHIFFRSAEIEQNNIEVAPGENKSLSADYNGHADIVSLGINWMF